MKERAQELKAATQRGPRADKADGELAFIGSESLSSASRDRNRKLGVLVPDRVVIDRLIATFEHDWVRHLDRCATGSGR
jgi:hypothetical protein